MAIALASLALVPVPFILLARAFGLEIDAVMVGAGAGGWCVHLAVRMPAIALLSRWQREWWGVWLSGPMRATPLLQWPLDTCPTSTPTASSPSMRTPAHRGGWMCLL